MTQPGMTADPHPMVTRLPMDTSGAYNRQLHEVSPAETGVLIYSPACKQTATGGFPGLMAGQNCTAGA